MTSDLNILVSESAGFPPEALEELRALGRVRLADLDWRDLLDQISDVDVLWVRLRHFIGLELFEKAPRLRWIATPTTGLTHIDLESADLRGIKVISLRGETSFLENVRATAEFTMALMLALLRRLPAALDHVKEGGWNRDLFRGRELYERTVGIVGYGRLGKIVGRYLEAFGCCVIANDCRPVQPEGKVVLAGLPEVLGESDIVSLHADFSESNRSFFNGSRFAGMRPGSLFINTARGELVDESALLEALRSRHLAGAAIDVLADEHRAEKRNHALIRYAADHPNLLITPHIAGCTAESMMKAECGLSRIAKRAILGDNVRS